ncbi:MAG: hypothetical protein ACPLYX_11935, partial [Rectinema subterraneum]|uniref:hypothetical protein n=1 Tax=Rectinema subterraneum TaxID=2653714 RepID=UPI003C7AA751
SLPKYFRRVYSSRACKARGYANFVHGYAGGGAGADGVSVGQQARAGERRAGSPGPECSLELVR